MLAWSFWQDGGGAAASHSSAKAPSPGAAGPRPPAQHRGFAPGAPSPSSCREEQLPRAGSAPRSGRDSFLPSCLFPGRASSVPRPTTPPFADTPRPEGLQNCQRERRYMTARGVFPHPTLKSQGQNPASCTSHPPTKPSTNIPSVARDVPAPAVPPPAEAALLGTDQGRSTETFSLPTQTRSRAEPRTKRAISKQRWSVKKSLPSNTLLAEHGRVLMVPECSFRLTNFSSGISLRKYIFQSLEGV